MLYLSEGVNVFVNAATNDDPASISGRVGLGPGMHRFRVGIGHGLPGLNLGVSANIIQMTTTASILKDGAGSLSLTASNSFTDTFTVNDGSVGTPHAQFCPSARAPVSRRLEHLELEYHAGANRGHSHFGWRAQPHGPEGTCGAVFPALLERPRLHVWAVHPATSARYRAAFTPAGARDDAPDAQLLLELLLRHRDQLTPLSLGAAATRKLAGQNLARPLALDFLKKWPDLLALKSARALTTDAAIVNVAVGQARVLVEQLRVVQRHVGEFDDAIAAQFRAHPDAALFRGLPGAGAVLAPRLLVAFGSDRDRYPDPGCSQKYAGLAPVREKSGGALWTHWRWHAPTFLRQSFVEWADQAVVYCDWARAYCEQIKAKGKGHWAILRALA
jgi:autotransporter-associated beta strand protein